MAGHSGLIGQLALFHVRDDQNQEEDTVSHSSAMENTIRLRAVNQETA